MLCASLDRDTESEEVEKGLEWVRVVLDEAQFSVSVVLDGRETTQSVRIVVCWATPIPTTGQAQLRHEAIEALRYECD